jgi:hypothetical protein
VQAALDAMKAKPGVEVSDQGGWTIVTDPAANTLWSFTPASHPAHPAAVKRTFVSRDGTLYLEMGALCQASQVACDNLMDEFNKLNDRMSASMGHSAPGTTGAQQSASSGQVQGASADSGSGARWSASAEQVQRVESQSRAYFAAKDERRYEEAYSMLSAAQKKTVSFERWRAFAEDFNSRAGEVRGRVIRKITWYKNPAEAAPGTYAAVDFSGRYANVDIDCGYVAWVEQADGSFLIVHEEHNFIEKNIEQKMKPAELEKIRAEFGCVAWREL